ncbi:unnamed protein product [[Actinomadura] parvosata subsp. kistnae]|nr:hypothetical protein [Nonomuraea sp. ATCC 55076]SPL93134.1 unnamed protein product [Actinomadura parvosata subsp. kistnae]
MIYACPPFSSEVREVVAATWGVEGSAERLHGGEESARVELFHRLQP